MPRVSRRQFVQTSVAGPLAAALAAWVPCEAASSSAGERNRLHAAVFDERFTAAVRFGQAAADCGLLTRGVRGDLTGLWYHELLPLWKARPAALAGLTTYAALFCLEQLAWDHRLRVVYRAAHRVLANGTVEHLVSAPQNIAIHAPPSGAADWPPHIATMIARVERRRGWSGLAGARAAEHREAGEAVLTLHSWVIAATARA